MGNLIELLSSSLVANEGVSEKTDEIVVVGALGEGQGLRMRW